MTKKIQGVRLSDIVNRNQQRASVPNNSQHQNCSQPQNNQSSNDDDCADCNGCGQAISNGCVGCGFLIIIIAVIIYFVFFRK